MYVCTYVCMYVCRVTGCFSNHVQRMQQRFQKKCTCETEFPDTCRTAFQKQARDFAAM